MLYVYQTGTYYFCNYNSYSWELENGTLGTALDAFVLVVHINGSYDETSVNAVFDDGVGNTYTLNGSNRTNKDPLKRVFAQNVTYDAASDVTYNFSGGLYYPDSGEAVQAGDGRWTYGGFNYKIGGFFSDVSKLAITDEQSYSDISDIYYHGTDTYYYLGLHKLNGFGIGDIKIDGSKPGTYYLFFCANYEHGQELDDGHDGIKDLHDYYFLIVTIK